MTHELPSSHSEKPETVNKKSKSTKRIQQETDDQREAIQSLCTIRRGYAIRIAKQKDRERAIEAFMSVPFTRSRVAGNCFIVFEAHIEALKARGIPFEDITGTPID